MVCVRSGLHTIERGEDEEKSRKEHKKLSFREKKPIELPRLTVSLQQRRTAGGCYEVFLSVVNEQS